MLCFLKLFVATKTLLSQDFLKSFKLTPVLNLLNEVFLIEVSLLEIILSNVRKFDISPQKLIK